MKKLVLITVKYPIDKETFLDYELPVLNDFFDEIQIISTSNSKKIINRFKGQFHSNIVYRGDLSSKINIFTRPIVSRVCLLDELNKCKNIACLIKTFYRMQIASKLCKILENEYKDEIDNIVFYSYWLNAGSLALSLLRRKNKSIKTIARAHGSDIFHESSKSRYNPFQEISIRGNSKIYSISECGKEYLELHNNIQTGGISVSRLGVKIPTEFKRPCSRLTLNLVSCSSIDFNKRVYLIVKALSKIDDINIYWIHFGTGDQLELVRNLAVNLLGGKDNISWTMAGQVDNAQIHQYYAKGEADLFINLSISEGVPVSIMEAMSYGVLAIATDVGGTNEVVNNKCGYLLSDSDVELKVIESIKTFYRMDYIKKLEMQDRARQYIIDKYSSPCNFKAFALEINKL
jgi:colanic acid/amylovoran biosynthesis glycosyltransferase